MQDKKLRDPNDTTDYDIFREEYGSLEVADPDAPNQPDDPPTQKHRRPRNMKKYIIGFGVFLLVIASAVGLGMFFRKKHAVNPETTYVINTQSLDNGTLNQLTAESGGTGKQQLTISPDTLFQGSVTINKELTVKGQTSLQSAVNIGKDLGVGGNGSIAGNLSVKGLISAGNLNVGSVTIGSLHLSGDLEFNGHLLPTGATPSIKADVASGGGTATIQGNDTVGTISITTGSNPTIAGQIATVTFRAAFPNSPKVLLTPSTAAAAKLDYFVIHSAGFFSIEGTSVLAPNTIYSFDYLVIE